jgi:hypothetical protein
VEDAIHVRKAGRHLERKKERKKKEGFVCVRSCSQGLTNKNNYYFNFFTLYVM